MEIGRAFDTVVDSTNIALSANVGSPDISAWRTSTGITSGDIVFEDNDSIWIIYEIPFSITTLSSLTAIQLDTNTTSSSIKIALEWKHKIEFTPNTRVELDTAVLAWTTDSSGAAIATYGDINTWNVSQIDDMSNLFQNYSTFNDNIGGWNVSQVTNMTSMFDNAQTFNQDIGGWNVSKVTDMNHMFFVATNFNQNIGGWNVSKVTDMSLLFHSTSNFNQDIGEWNVSQVTDMNDMFRDASNFNQNIGGWDVSQVTDMYSMFSYAKNFNQNIENWNVLINFI